MFNSFTNKSLFEHFNKRIKERNRIMKIHKLKILNDFADAVYDREKTFEIRLNDRGFQKGDKVRFKVINKKGEEIDHILNLVEYEITYVLNGWGLKEDYVVFGIKDTLNREAE